MTPHLAVAIGAVLAGWLLTRRTHKDTHLPKRLSVHLGLALVMAGWVLGVLVWPASVTLAMWWIGGHLLLRSASRRALGWVSLAEVLAEAVHCGWVSVTRIIVSSLFAAGGLALTAMSGWDHAAVLGTGVALIPSLWWVQSGVIRQAEQNAAEARLAGLFKGGRGWDALASDRLAAPVQVKTKPDDSVSRVIAPIPAEWDSTHEERIELDVQNRMCEQDGERWPVTFRYEKPRRLITRRVPPLPRQLPLMQEMVPANSHEVYLGRISVSKLAAKGGIGPYAHHKDLVLSLRVSPHWMIVGETGGGKSWTLTNLVVQLASRGWDVRFVDPKKVEGTSFLGRQGITGIAVTMEQMVEMIEEAARTVNERMELCTKHRVKKVWALPEDVRKTLPPIGLIVDELVELLAHSMAKTDEAKALNELKDRIAVALESIGRLGRAADVHIIGACQRADRKIVAGLLQVNLSTAVLMNPAGANSTTRTMADLAEVTVDVACPGRAVIRSIGLAECEMQSAYVDDEEDLDQWLPMVSDPPALPAEDEDALVPVQVSEQPEDNPREPEAVPLDISDEDLDALLDDDESA